LWVPVHTRSRELPPPPTPLPLALNYPPPHPLPLQQARVVTTSHFCSEFEVDVDAATHVFKVTLRIRIHSFQILFSRQKDGRGQDVQVAGQEEAVHSSAPAGAEEVT
jgi:hypothetical protein